MQQDTMQQNTHKVDTALIRPSQEGLPVSVIYDDFYFSTDNALEEKYHVFIHNNHLPDRFSTLLPQQTYTLCELGFGTGLNFLLTLKAWLDARTQAHGSAFLRFISIEQHPLSLEQLKAACALWPTLSTLSQALIDIYPVIQTPGFHHLSMDQFGVELTLIFDHVEPALIALSPCPQLTAQHKHQYNKAQQREARKGTVWPDFDTATQEINNTQCGMGRAQQGIDGWFFDGFSPAKNADMWSANIFILAAHLSHKKTHYATFTAASFVRKNLEKAGFSVEKTVGYGKKREMIKGIFIGSSYPSYDAIPKEKPTTQAIQTTPKTAYRKKNSAVHFWHLQPSTPTPLPSHVCVIGAGIAGAHIAFALAQKNIRVTVYDKASHIASGASGNAQGVVYTKLSPKDDHLSIFNLGAQFHADRFYHQHHFYKTCGASCGVVHLATDDKTQQNYQTLASKFHSPHMQWHDNPSPLAGVQLHHGGLVLPHSGWLNPQLLCKALLSHKNITVRLNQPITQLKQTEPEKIVQWCLYEGDKHIDTACNVVVSCAYEATQFEQTSYSQVKAIRGQVTHFHTDQHSAQLKVALCGYGYIAPTQNGQHCAGATFNLNTPNLTTNPQDDKTNIQNLYKMSNNLHFEQHHIRSPSRAAFRTATPDYFPIVGAVVNQTAFNTTFNRYHQRGNAFIPSTAEHHKGLYLNIGYGSRGLAYAPLCTAMLCKQIMGEPLSTGIQTAIQLHPSRFLFRALVKGPSC